MVDRRKRPNVAQPDGRRFTDQQFLSVQDIAERLGFTEKQVRKWIKEGSLAAHRFGTDLRIEILDIERYVAACRVASSDGV